MKPNNKNASITPTAPAEENASGQTAVATFGSGCFWCTEAVFRRLKGVREVISGYSGGTVKNPAYREICAGNTGHAEVVQVVYDPLQITFEELLFIFWKTHDPTTLNRQGADTGTQYRSVIFYHSEEQRISAETIKRQLVERRVYSRPIVTEISPLINFFPAETYHQDYYRYHSDAPYCQFVIAPKLIKLESEFREKLKS